MNDELKLYELTIKGTVHTFQLDEATAKAWGATPVTAKVAPAPRNKSRRSVNK